MRALLLLSLVPLAACEQTKKGSMPVGAGGGSLQLNDSSVTIPAGALSSPVEISIQSVPNAAVPTGTDPVGTPLQLGPEGQSFAQPVAVRLAVDLNALPAGRGLDQVMIFTAPAGSSAYEPLVTTVDGARHVFAAATHFSVFVAVIAKPGVDLAGMTSTDAGTQDMSAGLEDMSVGADMSAGSDLACARTFIAGAECSMSKPGCGGTAYNMSCGNFELQGWKCRCSTTNPSSFNTVSVGTTTCDSEANALQIWQGTGGCAFP